MTEIVVALNAVGLLVIGFVMSRVLPSGRD